MLTCESRWGNWLCLLRWCPHFSSDYSENRWHYRTEKTYACLLNLPASSNVGIFHHDRVLAGCCLLLRAWPWLRWQYLRPKYLLVRIHDEEASVNDNCRLRYNWWLNCNTADHVLRFYYQGLAALVRRLCHSLIVGVAWNDLASGISWLSLREREVWWSERSLVTHGEVQREEYLDRATVSTPIVDLARHFVCRSKWSYFN